MKNHCRIFQPSTQSMQNANDFRNWPRVDRAMHLILDETVVALRAFVKIVLDLTLEPLRGDLRADKLAGCTTVCITDCTACCVAGTEWKAFGQSPNLQWSEWTIDSTNIIAKRIKLSVKK